MNLKKIISAGIAAATLLSLAACGSGGDASAKKDDGGSTTIKFGIWDAMQKPGMQKLADQFEKENPDIKVDIQVTPWDEYWTKMEAAATGGELPDVFWMHTNEFLKYASNDVLMDLSDLKGTNSYKDYPESLVSLATYKDKIYGVPKDFDTIALAYNKEIFDNANIAYPDETWDWNKLLEVAKELTDKEKGIFGFSAGLEDQEGYLPPIAQAGGYVMKDGKAGYTNADTRKGVQFYVDLNSKEGVAPTLSQIADNNTVSLFQSGKVAMCYMGSWRMATADENKDITGKFDVAKLPKGENDSSIINGLSYVASNKTKHPKETKLFLSYLASKKAQDLQAETGTAISARNGSADKWLASYPDYNAKVYLEMKENAVPVSTSLTKAKWVVTEKEMMKRMLEGDVSVDEGTQAIQDEMEKLLKTEK